MIESRYSIEYIDPDSEKSSSTLGKLFIYSILTISILAAIITLIYSNLPNSTSQIITDKVQQFVSSFNEFSTSIPVEKAAISKPKPPIATLKEKNMQAELAQQKSAIAQLEEDKYKKEIERLTEKNTTQQNKSVKQLTAKQALSKKVDALSMQLNSEIQKSTLLKKEVTLLETENKTVSALLEEAEETVKNHTNEIKIVSQPTIIKPATPEPIEIKKVKSEVVAIKETMKSAENIATKNKNIAPISQIDAIVAAMEAANNASNSPTVKK